MIERRFIGRSMTLVLPSRADSCQELAYPECVADETRSETEILAAALVAAFPSYVEAKLGPLNVLDQPAVLAAAESGCVVLGLELQDLVALPLDRQTRSPLELVRSAMSPITEALLAAGVTPPPRDAYSAEMHPEDVFELYPASSRDFGDQVWRLHMQWGLDKARVVAGMVPAAPAVDDPVVSALPQIALFGLDREHREGIAEAVAGLGFQTSVWRNPAALEAGIESRPALVLVDLSHPNAHEAIRAVAAARLRVAAIGELVDDFATAGAMALGAETAVGLDRIVDRLPSLLPRVV